MFLEMQLIWFASLLRAQLIFGPESNAVDFFTEEDLVAGWFVAIGVEVAGTCVGVGVDGKTVAEGVSGAT